MKQQHVGRREEATFNHFFSPNTYLVFLSLASFPACRQLISSFSSSKPRWLQNRQHSSHKEENAKWWNIRSALLLSSQQKGGDPFSKPELTFVGVGNLSSHSSGGRLSVSSANRDAMLNDIGYSWSTIGRRLST